MKVALVCDSLQRLISWIELSDIVRNCWLMSTSSCADSSQIG